MRPFAIERYFARFEHTSRHLLSSSDCEPLGLAEVLSWADDETRALWEHLSLAYTESPGLGLLRREIAGLYDGVESGDVLEVVPEEGIFLAMHAVLEPGDHVVATFPGYQSLYSIAEDLGCEVTRWKPRMDGEWRFDPDDLCSLMRPDTRLVVVNFPHNPTGALPSAPDFRRIAEIAADVGAVLFSDEMYRWLEQDPADRLPSAVELRSGALSLCGMSKTLSLPGLRVGWLVTHDAALLARLSELKDFTTICASAPSEVLAVMGLRARDRIVARNLAIISANLDAIDRLVDARLGFDGWMRPTAGSVGLVRWDVAGGTYEASERLAAEAGIMLLPSRVFDLGNEHVRLGFGRARFADALEELTHWI